MPQHQELTADDIWSMLQPIPAHDRDIWYRIGMALKSYLGDTGFSLFDDWSQTADNYKASAVRSTWRSFRGSGVGIGSLVHMANQNGWSRNTPATSPPALRPAPAKPAYNTGSHALRLCLAANTDDAIVAGHPYAIAKGITWAAGAARGKASGLVIGKDTDCIIVPIRDIQSNRVQGVQCISDQCVNDKWPKQNFGSVSGGALILGNTLDKSLTWYVVEGWASAVSMVFHHLNGNGVCACSFGKSMLLPVAKAIAEIHQPKEVTVIQEDDS